MTYRRLSRSILAGSALALVALWAVSLWWGPHIDVTTRPFTFRASAGLGCLIVNLDLMDDPAAAAEITAGAFRYPPDTGYLPSRQWALETVSRKHAPRRNFPVIGSGPRRDFKLKDAFNYLYRLEMPLWAPWLLLTGGALAGCRIMERWSSGGKEKELAAAGRSGEVSIPPPAAP